MNRLSLREYVVEVEDCMNMADRCRGNYMERSSKLLKQSRKITTCDELDLETLGFRPLFSKTSPDIDRQQIYEGSTFYVGWMRGVLIYDNSLSPLWPKKLIKGHFTHKVESPSPLHFKPSQWWERGASPSLLHITLEIPTEEV